MGSDNAALQREKSGHDTPKRELRSARRRVRCLRRLTLRGISRLDQFVKMFVVASDDCILRQIASGVDQVNALKRKNFL